MQTLTDIIDQQNQRSMQLNLAALSLKKIIASARYVQVFILLVLLAYFGLQLLGMVNGNNRVLGVLAMVGMTVYLASSFFIYRQHLALTALIHDKNLLQFKMIALQNPSAIGDVNNDATSHSPENMPLVEWYFAVIWALVLLVSIWH